MSGTGNGRRRPAAPDSGGALEVPTGYGQAASVRIEPVTIATVFAALLLACSSAPQRPNLLLFVTDTLRADALSCYGGPAQTPNICALADRGVLFEATYANGPWTPPSAVSLFTGNYPSAYAWEC